MKFYLQEKVIIIVETELQLERNSRRIFYANNALHYDYEIGHRRLGRISKSKSEEIEREILVKDIEKIENVIPYVLFKNCIKGKQNSITSTK